MTDIILFISIWVVFATAGLLLTVGISAIIAAILEHKGKRKK